MSKTIFTGFSPNSTPKDVRKACSFLVLPWKWFMWKRGRAAGRAEEILSEYHNGLPVLTYDSGRSALLCALRAAGIGNGDEVAVQAYTCVVVINAIRWTGAKPLFIDVLSDANMDPEDLKKKISVKTKALIIQHTFGRPAKNDELLQIARGNNLISIEDAAHALGSHYKGKLVGTMADMGMLSFGSDKIISCVRGGALVVKNEELFAILSAEHKSLPYMSPVTIFRHLMHYPVFVIGKAFYHIWIGKAFLALAKKIGLINKIIDAKEKIGDQKINKELHEPIYPAQLSNALATILINQLRNLSDNIVHRNEIARIYSEYLTVAAVDHIQHIDDVSHVEDLNAYVRYPLLVNNPGLVATHAKRLGVLLGNWYQCVVAPCDCSLFMTGYTEGSCPQAEALAKRSLNLPTSRAISSVKAREIIKILQQSL